jgi:peptide deformylase
MILPVYVFGQPILRKVAVDVDRDYEGLSQFITDMWDTMYKADGVGLAAPQVGKSIRLFVIDLSPFEDEHPELKGFKKAFLNAQIVNREGEKWAFNEGCISIPSIREDVYRPSTITIKYCNENFENFEETYDGIAARVIQHEYDHLEGLMFVDHLNPIRRRLLTSKLNAISKGKVDTSYKVKLPK